MALTGWPFMAVVIATAVAVVAATMLLWNRWPRRGAVLLRLMSLLLVMASGAAVMADLVNRDYGFYQTFGDLLGQPPVPAPAGTSKQARSDPPVPADAHGRVESVRLDGPVSGVSRDARVYLPAAYFRPEAATHRFPVIELLHGFPGGPHNWTHHLHVVETLDREIAAGRMPPVIAVAPTDYDHGRDSECVNAVRGQQNETYLAVDVPAAVARHYRALDTRASWAAIGYSTGGFCAVNIAFHHPERYGAAAALSGYFTAVSDSQTGDLYRGQTAVRQWNSPLWLAGHGRATVPLYLVASRGDPGALRNMQQLQDVAGAGLPVKTVIVPKGGHNFHVWYPATPAAFDWLAAHLPAAQSTGG
ncbi:alpha/beta hydrolase-fold protein [Streptomyces sp. H10-C2]|uniref:alpha/beta hydrolase-fold protein n=1 Tax=unclassified Streptomyces TaxID=2593676 RepID=UPI0024BB416D|nr:MULTISPECIES: alpha/beta hydrolase-fold protein [unclassified Streptomyces]MDJ0342418.1 alpha/beta hydrolase-fold protein [Streptomyces sp. PH10-H1]MDJ0372273.1 alpha/beta hydrolase-fold protein [Streptomyces sp. H10-C2]